VKAEFYNQLGQPHVMECRRAVFRDDFGNPLCVIIEDQPGRYWIKRAGEPDFHDALRIMGISDTLVVHHIDDPHQGRILLPNG
jgi:hypothetical protein